ncbi:SDR family oxidoreductase [Panacibacter ginsenosidivorans]|uniref:SDR family oxidoreductase n=2 Tax=Panacibacter ginsenosidivorans TaxID=1813871 RepID=A0A5B8VHQ8_9BACT|nr:SDR family oxidoreductase [Panacibacter ginsenosidivorans]
MENNKRHTSPPLGDGEIALVTGGAGGIGSAICKRLAEAGASVIITYYSNEEKAKKLQEELAGNNHSVFHTPVNDSERVKQLSLFIEEKYGRLDLLVNNAGITTPVAHDDLESLTDEWIDKIFTTNFRGAFATIRACKKLLLKSNDALVINISSVAAVSGIGSNVAYCASKAAMDSMTRSLARALAPKIRVVSVSPGWVMGEYAKTVDPDFLQKQLDATPLSRFATPEDVAAAVYALTTSLKFTTGSIIPVDGGRLLK